jgi:hypothetical protein
MMVYKEAARKTGAYMLFALFMGGAIVYFLSGELDPTGRVTSAGLAAAESTSWVVFLMGVFVGALVIGTYTYVTHIESKRQ